MTNEKVIKNNIHDYKFELNSLREKAKERKLTKVEDKKYVRLTNLLEREERRLETLELLGEEEYTKIFPYR